jgi:hypothetical protein
MLRIDWDGLAARANGDGEFRLAARAWTATLRLDLGDESRSLRIQDGAVRDVAACAAAAPCDVFVSAPGAAWEQLLEAVPRPFYQDLFGATVHHGFALGPDAMDWAAHYPALRRLVDLLRLARER